MPLSLHRTAARETGTVDAVAHEIICVIHTTLLLVRLIRGSDDSDESQLSRS